MQAVLNVYLNVEKRRPRNIRHWRPNLLSCVNNIDAESVHSVSPDIISVHPGDENLPLVIVYKQSPNHSEWLISAFHTFLSGHLGRTTDTGLQISWTINKFKIETS